ncbi:ferredoxin [Actinoplanes sp. NPDC051346]|uniref:ferredoxin n=1 Tax=Actinoplanes sp. NPDC051346 TaxID=3155048 RepID=UPI00343A93EC
MSLRVEIQEQRCVAAGQCVMVAPDVFDQRDDDGVAVVLHAEPDQQHHDAVHEAASMCPSTAILLVEG